MKALSRKKKLTSFQIISGSFAAVILTGTLFLMLPLSSTTGTVTPFSDALFTATSAVCVTGLVVRDTASSWSAFGQVVILLLIQIGGLGVVTVGALIAILSGRRISLKQRSTMQEAIAAPRVGGIVELTRFILKVTFLTELAGAVALMPVFTKDYGIRGFWMAIFHSISAFCNAGFDILGTPDSPYQSLTSYSLNPVVNITIVLLIILGGIGFITWKDAFTHKLRLRHYRMQSKVILTTTAILIIIPTLIYYYFDFANMSGTGRFLYSLFQAVTPRTAGFNTADLNAMSGSGRALMIVLMLIGGSPGSTAGGMKTTTVAVLIANTLTTFRQKEDVQMFRRRVEPQVIGNAATILVLYISLFFAGGLIIGVLENLPPEVCFFETASAVGTVGLTLGITPQLGLISRLILIVLMFMGRVGGLTLIYAALSGTNKNLSRVPVDKITVG